MNLDQYHEDENSVSLCESEKNNIQLESNENLDPSEVSYDNQSDPEAGKLTISGELANQIMPTIQLDVVTREISCESLANAGEDEPDINQVRYNDGKLSMCYDKPESEHFKTCDEEHIDSTLAENATHKKSNEI